MTATVPRSKAELQPELRPRLRGVSHLWGFVISLPVGAALTLAAEGGREILGAAVFALGVSTLLATSAIYHRVVWRTARSRNRMRRVDHSAIFLLIACSYTPFGLLVLDGTVATVVLVTVWAGALIGSVVRIAWLDAPPWAIAVVYVALGWVAVIATPDLLDELGGAAMGLLALGGVLYTAGAVVYARRRPDPFPAVFGYHEIFHALVIAAALAQYAVVAFWVVL